MNVYGARRDSRSALQDVQQAPGRRSWLLLLQGALLPCACAGARLTAMVEWIRPWPLLLFFMTVGCGPEETVPADVLDRERFTEAMVGMTLLEARMSVEMSALPSAAPPMGRYYDELFRELGIDSVTFRRSFDHYAMRPAEMKAVYEEVVVRLRRMKDEWPQPAPANDTVLDTASSSDRN